MGLQRIAPVPMDDDVGGWLANHRKARGLSQRQLADRCGTTQSALSRIECNRTSSSIDTLAKLGRGLGLRLYISGEDILDG